MIHGRADRHSDSPPNNTGLSPGSVGLLKTSSFQVGKLRWDESYPRKQFLLPSLAFFGKHLQWEVCSDMNIVKCQWLCPWTCGQLVRVTIRPGLGWKTTSLSAQLASTHRNSLTDRSQGLLWNPQQSFLYTCRKFAYQSKAQRSGGQINMKDNQTETTLQRDMNSTIVLGNTHLLWLL